MLFFLARAAHLDPIDVFIDAFSISIRKNSYLSPHFGNLVPTFHRLHVGDYLRKAYSSTRVLFTSVSPVYLGEAPSIFSV